MSPDLNAARQVAREIAEDAAELILAGYRTHPAIRKKGRIDLCWEQRLSAWDMCAGAAIVLEAGGQLSDYNGGPADPRTGWIVASNGKFHAEAIAALKAARAER